LGRVYKAMHQTMNRLVALKILAPQLVKTERAQQLFLREVQTAAQLNHPNIVMAYDANEINGRHYLAMEFVDGPNLDAYVRNNGSLPVGLVCEIIFQAASGLQHAFERGMVHRDIKPHNLLFQQDQAAKTVQIKILDFGLAQLHQPQPVAALNLEDSPAKENIIMGTPDYLSPEQSRSLNQADIRSDIYSLGCTFYFLLTGEPPFAGGTTREKLQRHAREMPRSIEERRPDIPRAVADIVRKMMAKDPSERYETPDELMEALVPHAAPSMMTWPAPEEARESSITDEHPALAPPQADTEPKAQSSTQITDQESILEWVDANRRRNRRIRRIVLASAAAVTGLLALGVMGVMGWVLTR
jgi:serine/threonine-protein kinase